MIGQEAEPVRCIVLHPKQRARGETYNADYELAEAIGLAEALSVDIVHSEIVPLREINAANFLGGGKIQEIKAHVETHKATMMVVNAALSPIQQRNLEELWNAKVIDRTGLILEIFGVRAATSEGRLQVELARLAYERSRLVRTWTHLERQRGGQGFLSGPGETQIESDRRVLNDKMTKLRGELDQVSRTRGLQRQARQRAPERVVALVGYTNTGKSTLFNLLTKGGVLAKDMLFATLDTTHRVLELPRGKPAVLSDTVGFISDLPTDLISAFRATLEEVKEADLLLHIRDISDPLSEEHKDSVLDVLNQIEAGPEHGQDMIEVWNKADLLMTEAFESAQQKAHFSQENESETTAFLVSGLMKLGLEELLKGIEDNLSSKDITVDVAIAPKDFKVRAWLHEHGQVMSEQTDDQGTCQMRVMLSDADLGKLRSRYSQVIV